MAVFVRRHFDSYNSVALLCCEILVESYSVRSINQMRLRSTVCPFIISFDPNWIPYTNFVDKEHHNVERETEAKKKFFIWQKKSHG